jgi:hypothetical protein
MMAMKRMSMLAHDHHLSPEHRQLNEDVYQFKQESEKETLETADVLHHHNADLHDNSETGPTSEKTLQPQVVAEVPVLQAPAANDSRPSSGLVPSEGVSKESKEVTEKLSAVSLAASAKVSSAAN